MVMSTKRSSSRHGFTLVELLTVLAIVLVLAAILFSVFARVREKGRQSACLSNLKQLALGLQQYVQDYDGKFPASQDFQVQLISTYIKTDKVFRCPSAAPTQSSNERDYDMTGWLDQFDFKTNKVIGKYDSVIADSATTVLFYEIAGYEEEVKCSCFTGKMIVSHFNGANYAFVDGHVKWRTSLQAAESLCSSPEFKALQQTQH
jgi:prepilin-type N-terminal cleavage/methylation domain-containing protein/prepilin-type processing-associated H-X9-DG protein